MPTPLLATKLFIPRPRPNVVSRPRLLERLNEGLQCNLILIAAPAGFGKTTLLSEWVANCEQPAARFSLDEADSDPARFLTYFVAAVQTIAATIGAGVLSALQSSQPPPLEALLVALLNDLSTNRRAGSDSSPDGTLAVECERSSDSSACCATCGSDRLSTRETTSGV